MHRQQPSVGQSGDTCFGGVASGVLGELAGVAASQAYRVDQVPVADLRLVAMLGEKADAGASWPLVRA
jgi:hypothetical protein